MNRRISSFLACMLIVTTCFGTGLSASAATVPSERETAAAFLHDQGIMVGNESGDMMLDQGLTRAQMAALLTRIVANPGHVEADSDYYRNQCKFTDVPDWAKVYVGYCAANHLVGGYGNSLYGKLLYSEFSGTAPSEHPGPQFQPLHEADIPDGR